MLLPIVIAYLHQLLKYPFRHFVTRRLIAHNYNSQICALYDLEASCLFPLASSTLSPILPTAPSLTRSTDTVKLLRQDAVTEAPDGGQ